MSMQMRETDENSHIDCTDLCLINFITNWKSNFKCNKSITQKFVLVLCNVNYPSIHSFE